MMKFHQQKNTKIDCKKFGAPKGASYIYGIEIKVMKRFEKENQDLFIALASILNTKGADIEMKSDFDHWCKHEEIKYTNVPEIRGYHGPEGEGFYFRARHNHFGIGFQQLIASFPINIDGYKFEMIGFSDFEVEPGERTWAESINFIVTKNGKNVI